MRLSRVLYWAAHPQEIYRRKRNERCLHQALSGARGVVHVGANTGHERSEYSRYGLPVLWVEPLPEAFAKLQRNVAGLADHRCVQALVADEDGKEFTFHVSNNDGLSSSIFDIAKHREIWPEVEFVRDIVLASVTLPTLLGQDASQYDYLVMDTQGSELLILKGAMPLLGGFRYIKTEVADFESYAGCVQRDELTAWLNGYGFRESVVEPFAERPGGGRYFDILYRRQ